MRSIGSVSSSTFRLSIAEWTGAVCLATAGLLLYSIGPVPPLVVALGLLTQPAISATIGWLVYRETLSATDLVGAVGIALALVLVRLPERGLRSVADAPSSP